MALESMTIVLYDIPHDRTRTKVSEKGCDFGVSRFQYSAFQGMLSRNRREELPLALEEIIEVYGGVVALLPVCAADCDGRIDVYVEPPPIERVRPLQIFHEHADVDDCDSGE